MKLELDRYWLITWCTYGSWLPSDPRGFVGPVRDGSGTQVIHNIPGTPPSDTWWVDSGSKRKLPNRQAVLAAIKYVVDQKNPLLLWTESVPELNLPGGRIAPGPR
jgi:hypothetical protein